jgi:mRNA interferase HicA
VKRRDIIKQLESAGYSKCRDDGDHTVYAKENCRPISVPRHREVNENTARAILKAAGLK